MLVKALRSFCGLVNMRQGEVKDLSDEHIVSDLLNAKYIEEVKTTKAKRSKKEATNDKDYRELC